MAIVIWLPRAFQLDQFVTTDEVAWLPRSANFYYALGQRDFAATQMNEAPGITLLWTETAAYLIHFPQYRGFGQGLLDKYKFYEQILAANGVQPLEILTTSRIIMVLIHTFVLAVTFFIAQRIFGLLPAVVGFLFIAFDPYHNALTRLAHLDGPMSSFLYLSLVAFLAYLLVRRSRGYLLISAAAGGLAVLSKIPAWVAVPTIALFAILDYFVWTKRTPVWGAGFWPDFFKRLIRPLLVWGAVFLVTLFVFYPAMWVQPVTALKALILSPLGFAAELANSPAIQNDISIETAEIAAAFGDNPLNYVLRYPAYYLITSSWVVLLGLLAALLTYLFKKGALAEVRVRRGLGALLLFALLYTLIMTIPPKSSPKYYLPVHMVLDLAAGIGWAAAAAWLVAAYGRPLASQTSRFAPRRAAGGHHCHPGHPGFAHLPLLLYLLQPLDRRRQHLWLWGGPGSGG